MGNLIFECDVTEYAVISLKAYNTVTFCIHKNCVVISFLDKNQNILAQSEISIEDFKQLQRITI